MARSFAWLAFGAASLVLAPAAVAQSAAFNGPTLGFVFSRTSHLLRPLIGVPGASHLGPSVLQGVDTASVAPDGNRAFVVRSRRAAFVSGLSSLSPADVSIANLMARVSRIVWSRDGSYALLYSSSTKFLQRVTLSGTPSADAPVDLSSWGLPSTLAIDPTGRQIAFGIPNAGVYLLAAGQSPVLLSPLVQPAALAFDSTGSHLYAADTAQQQIIDFDSGSGPVLFASLVQTDGSAADPAGLAVSGDGTSLVLADRNAHAVLVYDLTSRQLSNTIPLTFAPTRFEALSSSPTFLLNGDNSREWLLILDARTTPAVYFVPAGQEDRQ